jgi:UDP-4-amino-4,6-dideoxy-N-acetyl-beta-L-altrosamine transaminase
VTDPLPYGRQDISDDDVRAVERCLRGDWLTQGPAVARFEEALCASTGARFAVAAASGTAALHLATLALEVGPGDVGVTSPITFVATANALRYVGAEVEFADVDPTTGLVDVAELERVVDRLAAAGRAPKVLLPVDYAGRPPDLARIRRLADRVGARIVEDAAHALGADYVADGARHRVGACAHADLSILSFHPVKHITTAEGGALLTNDEALAARARQLRSHGIHRDPSRFTRTADDPMVGPWYHEQDRLGYHYRLTDLQCALGASQLERLGGFVERRRALARRYDRALAAAPFAGRLIPLREPADTASSHHLYVVRFDDGGPLDAIARRRKAAYLALRARGIEAQVHYIPVHWQPFHRSGPPDAPERFPAAARFYASCLSLPMFPRMHDDDLDRVVDALGEIVRTIP